MTSREIAQNVIADQYKEACEGPSYASVCQKAEDWAVLTARDGCFGKSLPDVRICDNQAAAKDVWKDKIDFDSCGRVTHFESYDGVRYSRDSAATAHNRQLIDDVLKARHVDDAQGWAMYNLDGAKIGNSAASGDKTVIGRFQTKEDGSVEFVRLWPVPKTTTYGPQGGSVNEYTHYKDGVTVKQMSDQRSGIRATETYYPADDSARLVLERGPQKKIFEAKHYSSANPDVSDITQHYPGR